MKNIERTFIKEHELYPKMELRDYYKVLYGGIMGPSHLLLNKEKAENLFMIEWDSIKPSEKRMYDDVTMKKPMIRLHLSACKNKELNPSCVFNSVVETAKEVKEDISYFYRKLDESFKFLKKANFNIMEEEFISFEKYIKKNNYPVMSHSDIYRKLYEPHYRFILLSKFGELL